MSFSARMPDTTGLVRPPELPRFAQVQLRIAGVGEPRFAPGLLALVLGVHAVLLATLMHAEEQFVAPPVEQPILIKLVPPAAEKARAEPQVAPPKFVKPVTRQLTLPQPSAPSPAPLLAAAAEAHAPTTPAAEAVPPTPSAVPLEATPQPAAPDVSEEPPAPLPVEPPRFNANYLDNPSPAYPSLSRRLGEEGRVLLRINVDAGGQPSSVILQKTSGHARLDEAAAETVRHWKFIPARQGGQPVAAWVIVPIQFSLKG